MDCSKLVTNWFVAKPCPSMISTLFLCVGGYVATQILIIVTIKCNVIIIICDVITIQ